MDSPAGYVYIVINPSLNGIVKIGKTQNSPEERVKELSSATGVPTPYFVAYSSYFKDCNAAEIFVHTRLESNRLADNREFFRVSVQKAIETVREAEATFGVLPEPLANKDLVSKETSTKPLAPWKVVFHSANAHFYGTGDTIQDQSEALHLYLKAAKLGSISAYWIIGNMYLLGKGCTQDIQKARKAFLEGTKMGNDLCWTGLADVYWRENHFDNWNKCWKKYFESVFFLERKQFGEYSEADVIMGNAAWQMCFYIYEAISRNWDITQQKIILESKAEILGFILDYRLNLKESGVVLGDVTDTVFNLVEQDQGKTPQRIVKGTSSEYFANRYNKPRVSDPFLPPFLPPVSDNDLKRKRPQEIFQLANAFYYNDASEGHETKALYLYEKAALAGYKLAYWKVGRMYSEYPLEEKAKQFLAKGIELGVDLCWTELAGLFEKEKNFEKWNYCWKRYFESETFLKNVNFNELVGFDKLKSNRLFQMFFYIQQASDQWKTTFMPIVTKFRKEISKFVLQNSDSVLLGALRINFSIEAINLVERGLGIRAKDYCREVLAKIPKKRIAQPEKYFLKIRQFLSSS